MGLRLHTLPFVRAPNYCHSINGDIKKLWWIPQVSYHWERDQPKQAEQGWAFKPEALDVFTVFMWQSYGLDFHCASLQYRHENVETVKAALCPLQQGKTASTDRPGGGPLCLYKTHTCVRETLYFDLKGKWRKIPPSAFKRFGLISQQHKINIKPSSSCHGKCPTLSQSKQTNLLRLLNSAWRVVSHPYMYPSNKVSFNMWKD